MSDESGQKFRLKIDTSSNRETVVSLIIDEREITLRKDIGERKPQLVLEMIDTVLKKNGLSIEQLNEIEVVAGPGSFTGLRVGVAVANTLSYWLNIPINGQKAGTQITPRYE